MAVCVGPEFRPDEEGRLRLSICGAPPAEQAWPYPGPKIANPLRVDPDCGLWAPPPARLATVEFSGSVAGGPSNVPAGWANIDSADITIANPSLQYPAMVLRWVTVDVDFIVAYNDGRAAARIAGNIFQSVENSAPTSGSAMNAHWEHTQPMRSNVLIPPGGSQTYTAPIDVGLGQGGSQWAACRWTIYALIVAGLA